jgi:hypothetical protein
VRVLSEEGLLPLGVAPIGAMRIGIDELADRKTIRLLSCCDVRMDCRVSCFHYLASRASCGVR